ncbi:MAG TPA: hypothetical protein VJN70_20795 [Gemmatimonadaceae bacterium]|nr:hypothetical protein [Gemmatimonadaceae bacterium]
MRFVWPAQRYDRLTKGPAALALALTIIACVVTAIPLVTIYRASTRSKLVTYGEPREIVTFLQQQIRRAAASNRDATVMQTLPKASRVTTASKALEVDTGSLSPVRPQPAPAIDTSTAPADAATPTTRAVGPVIAPSGFSKVIIPEAAKDSISKRMAAYYLKLMRTFVLTPEQKDSAGREIARRDVAARDAHRPVAIPLGGFSISLPFGKSREQRLKDDSVHADNLQRLARLDERARAKRDSMLRASLAAKRDTDGRGDSLKRLTPRPDPRR